MKRVCWWLSALLWGGCVAGSDAPPADLSVASDLSLAAPVLRGGPLRFPVADPAAIDSSTILGMDHNVTPSMQRIECRNYAGLAFPFCYAGHEGTDFILAGGWKAMDAGSAVIVSAAPGRVVAVEDGHYDRCHVSINTGDVSCDGFEMKSNHVVIEHADYDGLPLRTEYHHMMKGSIQVTVGMQVTCGQSLGRIGSSGRSSLPHLHVNVRRNGALVDPYAGPFSQPQTLWREQQLDATVLPPTSCD